MSNADYEALEPPWPAVVVEAKQLAAVCSDPLSEGSLAQLRLLLSWMQAPGNLRGLALALDAWRVIELELTPLMCKELGVTFNPEMLPGVEGLASLLDLSDPHYHELVLRGFCATNPVYAALLAQSRAVGPVQIRSRLFSAVYCAYWRHYHDLSVSQLEAVWLAVRVLGDAKDAECLYGEDGAFCEPVSGEGLRYALMAGAKRFENQRVGAHLALLARLLSGELQAGVSRGGGGGHSGERLGIRGLNRIGDPLELPVEGDKRLANEEPEPLVADPVRQQLPCAVSVEEAEMATRRGVAPTELTSSWILSESAPMSRADFSTATDLSRARHRARERAAQVAMANQRLPSQWQQLNTLELYRLLSGLRDRVVDSRSRPLDGYVAVTILAMLSRSLPIEAVFTIGICSWEAKTAVNHLALRRRGSHWSVRWHLHSAAAALSQRLSAGQGENLETTEEYLTLTLPEWLAHLFGQAFEMSGRRSGRKAVLVPKKWQAEVRNALPIWLAQMRRRYPGLRMSATRISGFLRRHATDEFGVDPTELAYFQGQPDVLTATPAHYTRLPESRLHEHYAQLWSALATRLVDEAVALGEPPWPLTEAVQTTDYRLVDGGRQLGSRKVPRLEAVQKVVRHLAAEVRRTRTISPVNLRTIAHHNAYTLYSLFFLLYASGYRAVCDPLPDTRLFDPESQFLLIQDKDGVDAYNTRLVWLVPDCAQQMEHYLDHIDGLRRRLLLHRESTFVTLGEQLQRWQSAPTDSIRKGKLAALDGLPPFFLLNERGQWRGITPGWLESEVLAPVVRLPLNANRHLLRTELVQAQCPIEVIHTFMGHWQRGEEPGGRFSTLALSECVPNLAETLIPLLRRLGWKPLRSIEL